MARLPIGVAKFSLDRKVVLFAKLVNANTGDYGIVIGFIGGKPRCASLLFS